MNGNKIKSVTVHGGGGYHVGAAIRNGPGDICGHISRIEDKSLEFSDSLRTIFNVYSSTGNLIAQIIDCSVIIEYF